MLTPVQPIAFVYHAFCMDGFGAAWAAYYFHPQKEHVFFAASYDDVLPENVLACDTIYFLDFAPPRMVILKLRAMGKKVVVIDHHKSAQENLEGLDDCVFDMNRSGAVLTWLYFSKKLDEKDPSVPAILRYIQDGDLYKFELPNSKEILAVFNTVPKDFLLWSTFEVKLVGSGHYIKDIIAEGAATMKVNQLYVELVKRISQRIDIFGYKDVPFVNSNPYMISDALSQLAKESKDGLAVSWYEQPNGFCKYSLRSTADGGIDVATLAKDFCKSLGELGVQGGGHERAAGLIAKKPIHRITG